MLTERALEVVLRRDRWIVAASLAAITLAAWGYLLRLAQITPLSDIAARDIAMPGMPMAVDSMGPSTSQSMQTWDAGTFGLMFLMWLVMMIGMMTPSAGPIVLLHIRVGRLAANVRALASGGWFLGGYILAWSIFSFAATLGQWILDRMALLTDTMALTEHGLTAGLLFLAGCYQFSTLKMTCLAQCQAPLAFIQRHGGFQKSRRGALALGLRHGVFCVGCCWALMLLLFGFGVMNLIWLAAIAAVVMVEKLIPFRWLSHGIGVALLAASVWAVALS